MFSWIPGVPELKTYALVVLGVLAAFGLFMWKSSQLGRVKDKVKGIKQARATERRVNQSIIKGLQNENTKKSNRNYDNDELV